MRILLAYDGFEHSRHALEEAAELGGSKESSVTVVSVVPETEARASKSGGHTWLAPHAHQDVAVAHKFLRERGVDAEMRILYGDPVTELNKEAAAGYDLVVVGSRKRGAVARLLLGTVSGRLVSELSVPVLIAGKDAAVRHAPIASGD